MVAAKIFLIIICVKLFLSCNNYIFLFTLYFINSKKNMCLLSHWWHGGWDVPRLIGAQNLLQGHVRYSLLPLHMAGKVNQSCMTADIWFHSECGNTIPVRSKRSTHCDRREGGTSVVPRVGHGTGRTEGGIEGGTWYRFILDI